MSASESLKVALVVIVMLAGALLVLQLVVLKLLPSRRNHGDKHVYRGGKDYCREGCAGLPVEHEVEEAENFRRRTESNKCDGETSGYRVCPNFNAAEESGDEKDGDDLRKCGECGGCHGPEPTEGAV